jgi:hypothetical protein
MVAPACVVSAAGAADDPLVGLGRSLDEGPDATALRRAAEAMGPVADSAALHATIDRLGAEIRGDFAAGRTVSGRGWLLAETEAAALVAYARAAG